MRVQLGRSQDLMQPSLTLIELRSARERKRGVAPWEQDDDATLCISSESIMPLALHFAHVYIMMPARMGARISGREFGLIHRPGNQRPGIPPAEPDGRARPLLHVISCCDRSSDALRNLLGGLWIVASRLLPQLGIARV